VSRFAGSSNAAERLVDDLALRTGRSAIHVSRTNPAHFDLHISGAVFDEVAAELADALDHFDVPEREKQEVLAAFGARKPEVIGGSGGSAAS
jgi:hypothetical protein